MMNEEEFKDLAVRLSNKHGNNIFNEVLALNIDNRDSALLSMAIVTGIRYVMHQIVEDVLEWDRKTLLYNEHDLLVKLSTRTEGINDPITP